jgi:hypothetical protein
MLNRKGELLLCRRRPVVVDYIPSVTDEHDSQESQASGRRKSLCATTIDLNVYLLTEETATVSTSIARFRSVLRDNGVCFPGVQSPLDKDNKAN